MEGISPDQHRRAYSLLMHSGILFLAFMVGISLSQILLQALSTVLGAGDLEPMLGDVKSGKSEFAGWVIALQAGHQIFGFAFAAIVTQWMLPRPLLLLPFTPVPVSIWLSIPVLILCIYALLPLVTLDSESFQLPESLSDIEARLEKIETESEIMLNTLLGGADLQGIIIRILIFSILPGVCEELFFRGALQHIFTARIGPHAAIWITGFLFSLIHFQIYGGIPRFLLGVCFGYLTCWSASLWPAMFAHALFNGTSLLLFYQNENRMQDGFDGIPVYLMFVATIVLSLTFYYLYKQFLNRQAHENG
jgi:uncharacterized protein